jgi:glycosyltransferase involved in cell wall biosynthesis
MGVVGRLSVEKGVDRAIRLVAALREDYPRLEMHLVGDGPQRTALEGLSAELGVADAVKFWGWRTDGKRFYEMMDLLLLPSHTEGLPNVVLEAMAMGVPVAATAVGGVSELLDNGHCGVVLSPGGGAWEAHVAPLLVSAARRSELARRARARVEEHYTFDRRMAKEMSVYKRLLRLADRPLRRAAA